MPATPHVPGYDAVAVPVLDSTLGNTDIMTRISLTFPTQLSLALLQNSWYELVRAWPILAARVRHTPSTPSGLSFLIPQPDKVKELEQRSRTTHKDLEKHIVIVDASSRSIASFHPIAAKAIESSLSRDTVSVGAAPDNADSLKMTCSNATTSLKQLIGADQAYITAHATVWSDATTIALAFSHIAGDAFSVKAIFEAWRQTIESAAPAPLQGVGVDPFISYLTPHGKNSKSEDTDKQGERDVGLPLGFFQYGFIDKVRLAWNLISDIKIKRPEKKFGQYYMYMPEEKVQALMAQARADVDALVSASDDSEKQALDTRISTFNVLLAWLLQNIHAANPKRKRMSTVMTIVNAKTRPPARHDPSDYPPHQLWGGALGVPLEPLASGDYASLPLGQLALHIRTSLTAQIDSANMQANIVTLLRHTRWAKPSGKLIFFARPNHYLSGCTEWRSTRFGEVDFGAAASAPSSVKPVAIGTDMEIAVSKRNRWVIFGDVGGGVWFSGFMTHKEATHRDGFGRYQHVQ